MIPSGLNMTVRATVSDVYGSPGIARSGRIDVNMPLLNVPIGMLTEALHSAATHPNLTLTELSQQLLIASEVAGSQVASGNTTLQTQVLSLLQTLLDTQSSIDSQAASTIIEAMDHLAANLTAPQATRVIDIAGLVANITAEMDQQTGSELLSLIFTAAERLQRAGKRLT